MPLPLDIYSVKSVRNIDQVAINVAGIDGYALMTRAGQVAFDIARRDYPAAKRWQVICGSGNNAGDGFVVARLAVEQGIAVSVLALSPPESLRGDAAKAYQDYVAKGGAISDAATPLDSHAELLVDALLGSGIQRDLEGAYKQIVADINATGKPIISLDIPSGLNADTGKAMGSAVRANETVTFVGLKAGLFLNDATEYVGRLEFSDLDIPDTARASELPLMRLIHDDLVRSNLPKRQRNSHKGDFGRLLVVGGAPGMPGAVRICGEAALRSGAGAVTIATHPSHSAFVPSNRPELMCHGVVSTTDLQPLIEAADVVALGPGLGIDDWSRNLFDATLRSDKPLVLDADALNLLANGEHSSRQWILTPHPGEAARLLGCATSDVQDDRPYALSALVSQYGGTVVLKGSGTLVSSASGVPWICAAGNPGMAAPGMGDALTGIVAALCGQGVGTELAAAVGVLLHAKAGDAAASKGERGLLVSDLLAEIRSYVNP